LVGCGRSWKYPQNLVGFSFASTVFCFIKIRQYRRHRQTNSLKLFFFGLYFHFLLPKLTTKVENSFFFTF
jgi:hypothetical protein